MGSALLPPPSELRAYVRWGANCMTFRPGTSVALPEARTRFVPPFFTQFSFNTFSSHCMWICCDFLDHLGVLKALFPSPLPLELWENALLLNHTPEATKDLHQKLSNVLPIPGWGVFLVAIHQQLFLLHYDALHRTAAAKSAHVKSWRQTEKESSFHADVPTRKGGM